MQEQGQLVASSITIAEVSTAESSASASNNRLMASPICRGLNEGSVATFETAPAAAAAAILGVPTEGTPGANAALATIPLLPSPPACVPSQKEGGGPWAQPNQALLELQVVSPLETPQGATPIAGIANPNNATSTNICNLRTFHTYAASPFPLASSTHNHLCHNALHQLHQPNYHHHHQQAQNATNQSLASPSPFFSALSPFPTLANNSYFSDSFCCTNSGLSKTGHSNSHSTCSSLSNGIPDSCAQGGDKPGTYSSLVGSNTVLSATTITASTPATTTTRAATATTAAAATTTALSLPPATFSVLGSSPSAFNIECYSGFRTTDPVLMSNAYSGASPGSTSAAHPSYFSLVTTNASAQHGLNAIAGNSATNSTIRSGGPVHSVPTGRVNQACASCRRKKVRCDGLQPTCGNCKNRGITCTYLAQKKRGRPPKSQQQQQQQQQSGQNQQQHKQRQSATMSGRSGSQSLYTTAGISTSAGPRSGISSTTSSPMAEAFLSSNIIESSKNGGRVSSASSPLAFPNSTDLPHSAHQQRYPAASSGIVSSSGIVAPDSSKPSSSIQQQYNPLGSWDNSSISYFSSQQQHSQAIEYPSSGGGDSGVYHQNRHQQQSMQTDMVSAVVTSAPEGSSWGTGQDRTHEPRQQQQHSEPQQLQSSKFLDFDMMNVQQGLLSSYMSASPAEVPSQVGSNYFGLLPTSSHESRQTGTTATTSANANGKIGTGGSSGESGVGLYQNIPFSLAQNIQMLGSATSPLPSAMPVPNKADVAATIPRTTSANTSTASNNTYLAFGSQFAHILTPTGGSMATSNRSASTNSGAMHLAPQNLNDFYFLPLTVPPPIPPLLQLQAQARAFSYVPSDSNSSSSSNGANGFPAATSTDAPLLSGVPMYQPRADEQNALSMMLGNVAMVMAEKDADVKCVQNTLDHLSYVTRNISNAKYDAIAHAREAAAEAAAAPPMSQLSAAAHNSADDEKPPVNNSQAGDDSGNDEAVESIHIHDTLLQLERKPDSAVQALHNYFCFMHHQCPIIHKPTMLRQIQDGTVNLFVWFSLRAFAARTLLHLHQMSESEVLIEEEYFATKARSALSDELEKPSVEVVQGLALLSLYIFGTPRWQEASMYWCKATRLAQLMEFHVIDAPSQSIATKLHFGIFEPRKTGTTHRDDLSLIPGDFAGDYTPLSQALTPLEAELRRRLWWVLFTNERFCAIAERLPTMVDESRMFVHFPCSAEEWDKPEFTYHPPARVPRYRRTGYSAQTITGDDVNPLTLYQELEARKKDNLYLVSEIEYGFSMSHLVAFFANANSLFRPRSPYGNDYTPMFTEMRWKDKLNALHVNIQRVEGILEIARQDILKRLGLAPLSNMRVRSVVTPGSLGGGRAGGKNGVDPILDPSMYTSGIEISYLHQLSMLILYSVLNIHLYRMVFQIHYEFASSLPEAGKRSQDESELLAAFDQYVKELWTRTTTAAQQVSRILRGEYPGVPKWVLKLIGIHRNTASASALTLPSEKAAFSQNGANVERARHTKPAYGGNSDGADGESDMDVDDVKSLADSNGQGANASTQGRIRKIKQLFQEKIKAQEVHLHAVTLSVFASFRRTLPYALILAAKVHIDNIEWWAGEHQDEKMAHAYLDLAEIVRFLETYQTAFSSTDCVALIKGMMRVDIN